MKHSDPQSPLFQQPKPPRFAGLGDALADPSKPHPWAAARQRAANADPATSHEAAAFVERTGLAAKQAAQVAEAVKTTPGLTSAELAVRHGLDRHMVARRLPECERDGLVRRGTPRTCGATGHRAMVWEVAEGRARGAA